MNAPNNRNLFFAISAVATLVILCGCVSESISGGSDSYTPAYNNRSGSFGGGELSQVDVIGIPSDAPITDSQIAEASSQRTFALKGGSRIMLVQSGAMVPDKELSDAMEAHYSVISMQGQASSFVDSQIDKVLRLTAVRGGADTIVVVWGVLESVSKYNATAAVAWVPIVGEAIPSKTKIVRIRLRAVVMDVKTGSWELVVPEVFQSDVTSSSMRSDYNFTKQKLELKQEAYKALATKLAEKFQ